MRKYAGLSAVLLMTPVVTLAADDIAATPARPHVPSLSVSLANEAARTAFSACHKKDGSALVEVFGSNGELLAFLSDDRVDAYDSFEHVRRKAYSVLQTQKPSRDASEKQLPSGNLKLSGNLFSVMPLVSTDMVGTPGALPIMRGNDFLGIISVDSRWDYAKDGEDWDGDEACAQAGLNRIKAQL